MSRAYPNNGVGVRRRLYETGKLKKTVGGLGRAWVRVLRLIVKGNAEMKALGQRV